MEILDSKHHITLEEIGRLEAAKAKIEGQIVALRATLPKSGTIAVKVRGEGNIKTVEMPLAQAPVSAIRAPDAKVTPRISDHAVIRYLERHFEFDFNSIRNDLLTKTILIAMKMGAKAVKVDGGKFIIRDQTVTTFVPNHDRRSSRAKRAARR